MGELDKRVEATEPDVEALQKRADEFLAKTADYARFLHLGANAAHEFVKIRGQQGATFSIPLGNGFHYEFSTKNGTDISDVCGQRIVGKKYKVSKASLQPELTEEGGPYITKNFGVGVNYSGSKVFVDGHEISPHPGGLADLLDNIDLRVVQEDI